jgi:hypothetical protein
MGLPQIPFITTRTKFVAHTLLEAFKAMLGIGITLDFLQQGFDLSNSES